MVCRRWISAKVADNLWVTQPNWDAMRTKWNATDKCLCVCLLLTHLMMIIEYLSSEFIYSAKTMHESISHPNRNQPKLISYNDAASISHSTEFMNSAFRSHLFTICWINRLSVPKMFVFISNVWRTIYLDSMDRAHIYSAHLLSDKSRIVWYA